MDFHLSPQSKTILLLNVVNAALAWVIKNPTQTTIAIQWCVGFATFVYVCVGIAIRVSQYMNRNNQKL